MTPITWLAIDEVRDRTTLPRTEINRLVKAGTFPKPESISGKAVWRETDIDQWIDTRPIADVLPGQPSKMVRKH